jgi:CBS-domain-containing membrane protein
MTDRSALAVGLRTGALLLVPGVLAWLSGVPFLFPSLGPSAFLLALRPDAPASTPRRVLGGHVIGVLAGLLTYHLLAAGAVATTVTAGSQAVLWLTTSGSVALILTAAGMVATDTQHAPACATTLIVSLGLLTTPLEGAAVVVAVVALLAAHLGLERVAFARPNPLGV